MLFRAGGNNERSHVQAGSWRHWKWPQVWRERNSTISLRISTSCVATWLFTYLHNSCLAFSCSISNCSTAITIGCSIERRFNHCSSTICSATNQRLSSIFTDYSSNAAKRKTTNFRQYVYKSFFHYMVGKDAIFSLVMYYHLRSLSALAEYTKYNKWSLRRRLENYLSTDWLPPGKARKFSLRRNYVPPKYFRKLKNPLKDEFTPMRGIHDIFSGFKSKEPEPANVLLTGEDITVFITAHKRSCER